jgi:hypothetical protein
MENGKFLPLRARRHPPAAFYAALRHEPENVRAMVESVLSGEAFVTLRTLLAE